MILLEEEIENDITIPKLTLGRHSYITKTVRCVSHARITIGNFSSVANDVVFFGQVHYPWILDKKSVNLQPFNSKGINFGDEIGYVHGVNRGRIHIGSDVWIGYGAYILDGVTIEDGAIIGSGAVIAKDVPPYAVMIGNPAVIKYYRYTKEQIWHLLRIKWWNWPDEVIKERMKYFTDIDVFLEEEKNWRNDGD